LFLEANRWFALLGKWPDDRHGRRLVEKWVQLRAAGDNHGVCSQSWTGTTSIEFAGEPSMIFELTAT
jgi:hypothetical protein